MMQMTRMMTMMMKISQEVKKGKTVIQKMTLKQMVTEELEEMRMMTTTTTRMEMKMTRMRMRMKKMRMKMTRTKHLSHQLRRGSENVDWFSTVSSAV